jgi:hypothetical protein
MRPHMQPLPATHQPCGLLGAYDVRKIGEMKHDPLVFAGNNSASWLGSTEKLFSHVIDAQFYHLKQFFSNVICRPLVNVPTPN